MVENKSGALSFHEPVTSLGFWLIRCLQVIVDLAHQRKVMSRSEPRAYLNSICFLFASMLDVYVKPREREREREREELAVFVGYLSLRLSTPLRGIDEDVPFSAAGIGLRCHPPPVSFALRVVFISPFFPSDFI